MARETFERELNHVKDEVLVLGSMVQTAILASVEGLKQRIKLLSSHSERLMTDFATMLGDWSSGPQTIGRALLQAKQRYFNRLPTGSFSSYDEKVLGESTLYGLPMLRIDLLRALPLLVLAANNVVERRAVRPGQLVDQLRTLSLAEAGALSLDTDRVDLNARIDLTLAMDSLVNQSTKYWFLTQEQIQEKTAAFIEKLKAKGKVEILI